MLETLLLSNRIKVLTFNVIYLFIKTILGLTNQSPSFTACTQSFFWKMFWKTQPEYKFDHQCNDEQFYCKLSSVFDSRVEKRQEH